MESLPAPAAVPTAPTMVRLDPRVKARVVLTELDIPFGDLVTLLVKLAVAVIPAAIILAIAGAVLAAVFGGLFAALGSALRH